MSDSNSEIENLIPQEILEESSIAKNSLLSVKSAKTYEKAYSFLWNMLLKYPGRYNIIYYCDWRFYSCHFIIIIHIYCYICSHFGSVNLGS